MATEVTPDSVQHMQPPASSFTLTPPSAPPLFSSEPSAAAAADSTAWSMPTAPNSFITSAQRSPAGFCFSRACRSNKAAAVWGHRPGEASTPHPTMLQQLE